MYAKKTKILFGHFSEKEVFSYKFWIWKDVIFKGNIQVGLQIVSAIEVSNTNVCTTQKFSYERFGRFKERVVPITRCPL